jgi:dolichol-phosphate mannosyltransferase
MLSFSEHGPFWRGIVPWIGFKQFALPYVPAARLYGTTKYTLKKMFRFAMDGITSFSVKPLHLATGVGTAISAFALLYAVYALGIRMFGNFSIPGWTSILVSVLFIGGIQLVSLGVLGEYIGKLFIESKDRPHYIVSEESE